MLDSITELRKLRPKERISRDELLALLQGLQGHFDTELVHSIADDALVAYIDDSEIAAAFQALHRWYA